MLPDAELVALTLLEDLADTYTALPADFEPPGILVQRVGGGPDLTDWVDRARVQISFYGRDRPTAWDLANRGQVAILTAAGREIEGAHVEATDITVGGLQVPDLDPDDRRIVVEAELTLDLRNAL